MNYASVARKVQDGFLTAFAFVLLAGLAACSSGGGGSGGNGGGTSTTPAIAVGTMMKGSVIVNGVHFTSAAAATIRIDDNSGRTEAELRDGMEVKVKGQLNSDNVTGQYEQVEAEPEVRGHMSSKGADDFLVNGQHVFVDDRTVFEDRVSGVFSGITFTALANTDEVEIHGGRDDLGRIRASRVERRDDAPGDEVKGTIATVPTGTTFELASAGAGTTTVDYSVSTVITPAGATLNLGDPIEVHGTFSAGIMTATIIDREDLEDADFEPAEGQELKVEGFVSGFSASPGTFLVGSRTVQTTTSTKFLAGTSTDVANGVEVEAEGHMTAGVLVADEIKFEDNVRIEANADASASAGVLGKTVVVPSSAELKSLIDVAAIAGGDGLRIRGFLNKDGVSFTATRIEKLGSPVSKVTLQGPVSAKTTSTVTIAGITVDLSGANPLKDISGTTIGLTQFMSLTIPGTSVVKAKGSFSSGTLHAEEGEIEE